MDLGRYVVFDEIASGGMSSVHFGRMLGPAGFGRTVAIKRLHPHYAKDPDFVSMLIDEARLVSRIHHPNVVPTLDIVHTKSDLFLVLEYVPGETLAKLQALAAEQGVAIPESVTLALVTNMLLGLDAAHEATSEDGTPLGIIHRDVSPQNVLVGTDGNARVLDFGIARAADASHRSDGGQVKGKIAYMSPEQLRLDSGLGRATDIYAASVVLWELLTGRRLFDRVEKSQIAALVLAGAIRSPRSVVPSISETLEEIVMRGLEALPEHRYATAREMAACLEAGGRMATAREVASFVASIAAASLSERALVVARIEKETASRVDVRALAAQIAEGNEAEARQPTMLPQRGAAPFADVTIASPAGAPRHGSRRALVLLGVAAAVCAVGGAVLVRQVGRDPRPAASSLASSASANAEPPITQAVTAVEAALPAAPPPHEPAERPPITPTAEAKARRREAPGASAKSRATSPTPRPSSSAGHDLFDRN